MLVTAIQAVAFTSRRLPRLALAGRIPLSAPFPYPQPMKDWMVISAGGRARHRTIVCPLLVAGQDRPRANGWAVHRLTVVPKVDAEDEGRHPCRAVRCPQDMAQRRPG